MDYVAAIQPGQWRQSTLLTPFDDLQPGDTLEIAANNTIRQKRNGVTIAESQYSQPGALVGVSPIVSPGTLETFYFFQEYKMPGLIETLVGVQRDGDSLFFNFDGAQLEFPSIAEALNVVGLLDTDPTTARHMLILKSIRNSPDGTNMETMVGASCSLDFQSATPVVITPPPQ